MGWERAYDKCCCLLLLSCRFSFFPPLYAPPKTKWYSVNIGSPFFQKGKYFHLFKFSLNLEPFFLLSRVTRSCGTPLFASYCSTRLVIEKQTFGENDLVWGKKRHQQEIKIGCISRLSPVSTSHTLSKGSKNNTRRWMAKQKTEKISDASRQTTPMHILLRVHRISSGFLFVSSKRFWF